MSAVGAEHHRTIVAEFLFIHPVGNAVDDFVTTTVTRYLHLLHVLQISDYEDIIISYYWGPVLKGFSKLQLSSDVPTDITKMKEGNEKLTLASLGSGRILVDCQAYMGKGPAEIRIYDMAGTLMESIRSESKDGIHQEIQLNHVSGKVIVVQVTSGGFSYVGKILID